VIAVTFAMFTASSFNIPWSMSTRRGSALNTFNVTWQLVNVRTR